MSTLLPRSLTSERQASADHKGKGSLLMQDKRDEPQDTGSSKSRSERNDKKGLDNTLEYRLRGSMFKHQDGDNFLPAELLVSILTLDDIVLQLQGCGFDRDRSSTLARLIHGQKTTNGTSSSNLETYLVVFALLVLLRRADQISSLVQEGVSDHSLPLSLTGTKKKRFYFRGSEQRVTCFDAWKPHERDFFAQWQDRLLVPFLAPQIRNNNGQLEMVAGYYQFPDYTILPWCAGIKTEQPPPEPWRIDLESTTLSENHKLATVFDGSEGSVICVKIVDGCHGFEKMLQRTKLSGPLFALKTLHESERETEFRNELEQLRRFNGMGHIHLVTLLATYKFLGKYHFLFPYADGTLQDLFELETPQPSSIVWVHWLATQMAGIVDALDHIHHPSHHPTKSGRHGDLKPDNILWYKSKENRLGHLVIADFGLSAFHNDWSRSNVPNRAVKHNPDYLPPECEIEGGKISPAYDVWNLGCVFMEMVVWFLGGPGYLDKFIDQRYSPEFTRKVQMKLYYEIQKYQGDAIFEKRGKSSLGHSTTTKPVQYTISVKDAVMEWFDNVYSHSNCSKFIHDVMEVIENKMLIVISQERPRASSGELKSDFNQILRNCMDNDGYCLEAVPRKKPIRPRSSALVAVILNHDARLNVENRPNVRMSSGPVLSAP